MGYFYDLLLNVHVITILGIVLALWLSLQMFPVILFLGIKKGLMDEPGSRSSHTKKVPNLGGIGIFIAFLLSIAILGSVTNIIQSELRELLLLLAAISIMFFLGVKDDLIGLSPSKKFSGQTIAASLVVFLSDVRIESFGGLFEVEELPYLASVILTIIFVIFIVNAFNLVDGIDGLAGSIAIVSALSFGIVFWMNSHYLLVLISFILVGAIIGFLRYNLSDRHKIFMGDSGSMFIGFILAFLAINFMNTQNLDMTVYKVNNAPILMLAILSFPIMDTLRVFTIRVKNGKSPFTADHNHIHHRLLDLGLTHKQCTLTIITFNLIIIGAVYFMNSLNINLQLVIAVMLIPIFCIIPSLVSVAIKQVKFIGSKI